MSKAEETVPSSFSASAINRDKGGEKEHVCVCMYERKREGGGGERRKQFLIPLIVFT